MAAPLLMIRGLGCRIGSKTLLQDVNLELFPGEFLVVIGPNGAGKSTLLKHAVGEMKSGAGQVQMFGRELASHQPRELARRRAVLLQSTPMYFDYQVQEVVLLGRIPHQQRQVETPRDVQIAASCLARVGLEGYEERSYLTLSGGEQQRVQLARVLAQIEYLPDEPAPAERLLFLDEPISSLDIGHQHEVLDVARRLTREGVGVLAILHDLNLAAQYADRIVVLADGQVLACGTASQVLTTPLLQQAFHYRVLVLPHPELPCPLLVTGGQAPGAAQAALGK